MTAWSWWLEQAHKFMLALSARPGTSGVTMDLGSGIDIEAQRAERRALIRAACVAGLSNPDWDAKDGKTFCNLHNAAVANAAGCHELDGKMANQQIEMALSSRNFSMESADRALRHVMMGGFAFAGEIGTNHGHVTPLVDEPMQASGSWGKPVPMVAHVGKPPNGIKRVSQAFRTEPLYFLYRTEDV